MAFDPDAYLKEKTSSQQGGFDPDAYLKSKSPQESPPDRSAIDKVVDGLDPRNWSSNAVAGLQKVDEYTGAPIRKFVTESLTGEHLDKAPSGADQAKRLGVTDVTYGERFGVPSYLGGNISPADVAGVGLEVIQDPFVIGSAIKKGGAQLLKGAGAAYEGLTGRQAARAAQSQMASAGAETAARAGAQVSGGGLTVEQGGKLFEVKAPKSLEELNNWKPQNGSGELLGKRRLAEIESNIPDLQTKPLKYHYNMMENPKAMKELKLQFENLPSEDAKRIAAYNQEIVDESSRKILDTVDSISGSKPKNLADAGDDLIGVAKAKYKAEKEALAPMFEALKQTPASSTNEVRDLAQAIGENTKLGKLMDISEEGRIFLKKNTPRSGISDSEHNVLARVIDDMNDGMTFKEMQDVREFLRKSVDPMNPGATTEINAVRKVMLDQMEHKAAQMGPSVGDTFKAYAKNERARENLERIIGGKIDSLDTMYAANPERVVNKIFSNPNYAEVVGEYVGPEKMRELVASYINNGVRKSYDTAKGFQPHTLRSWLKSNDQFLTNYAPEIKQRLNDLADYGYYGKRFLDEVNPSGTAASIVAALEPKGFIQKVSKEGILSAVTSETAGRVNAKLNQRQAIKTVNEALGGQAASRDATGSLKKLASSSIVDKAADFQKAASSSRAIGQESGALRSAEDRPSKGPEKWVNDGIEKLNQAGISRETLESLRKTKQGRDLLIEASDATPGSRRLDSVLRRVRTASSGGQ